MSDTEGLAERLEDILDRLVDAEQERYNPRVGIFDRDDAAEEANAARAEITDLFAALMARAEAAEESAAAARHHASEMTLRAEAAERDSERLDWLEAAMQNGRSVYSDGFALSRYRDHTGKEHADIGHLDGDVIHWGDAEGNDLRDAIDAARAAAPEEVEDE